MSPDQWLGCIVIAACLLALWLGGTDLLTLDDDEPEDR